MPAYEALSEPQRLHVLQHLIPGSHAPQPVPATQKDVLAWVRDEMEISPARWADPKVIERWEKNLSDAIEEALIPPPESESVPA